MKKLITIAAVVFLALAGVATAQAGKAKGGPTTATIAITAQTDGTLLVSGSGYTPNSYETLNEVTDHGSIIFAVPTDAGGNIVPFAFGNTASGPFTLNATDGISHGEYVIVATATWPGS